MHEYVENLNKLKILIIIALLENMISMQPLIAPQNQNNGVNWRNAPVKRENKSRITA